MRNLFIIVSLVLSYQSLAVGGSGGVGGGGGMKPEQRLVFEEYRRVSNQDNIIFRQLVAKPSGIKTEQYRDIIELDLNNLEEVTLKDGTVIKSYEFKEIFKNK